jgi:hypothetical protein
MAPKAKKEETAKKADEAKKADVAKDAAKADAGKADLGEKPQKPDEAAFQKRLDAVKEKIDKLKASQDKLSTEINGKNTGKEAYEAERQTLYDELATVKSEKEDKMTALKALKDSEHERRREERDTKKQMGALEKTLSSEEDIDKNIQAIEHKMATTTMSLKEEKELMNQIKKLKAGRPEVQRKVKEYELMKAKCESSVAPSALSVKEQIDALQKEFSEKADKHNEIYTKIKSLKEKRSAEMGDVNGLIDKKQKLRQEIVQLQEERTTIYNEKKEQMKVYNEYDKKLRLARKKEMEARWAAEEAERLAKEAAWELEKPNPYLNETTLLEQTIDYCRQLMGEGAEKVEVEKCDPSQWKAPVEGATVMLSKKDRDAEFFFAPTKGKKGLKGKKTDGTENHKSSKIKHTADTFKIFQDLKLPAPMTTGDVPPLLEKLLESQKEYAVKVKAWEDERKSKIEEAEKNKAEATAEEPVAAA